MAAAPQPTSPAWTPAADRLLDALQRGGVLHWTPIGGFILQLPSGKVTKPRLGTVWLLRRAGLIRTDDHDWRQPCVWRLVRVAGYWANQGRYR